MRHKICPKCKKKVIFRDAKQQFCNRCKHEMKEDVLIEVGKKLQWVEKR